MSTIENKFIRASQLKLRFKTVKGEIGVEDLWDMPLTATRESDKFDLDNLALSLEAELGTTATKSFVKKTTNKNAIIELRFDIVKFIIDVKLAEKEKASKARTKKAEKEKLLELLAKKKDAKLEEMSEEDILAQLAAIEE